MVQISLRLGHIDALEDELNCHWREGSRERRRAARWSISQGRDSTDMWDLAFRVGFRTVLGYKLRLASKLLT